MLLAKTVVFRQPADRKNLDLQNAESATALIIPSVAKYRAKKKEDRIKTDGSIVDLQVTHFFLSMCGYFSIIKLRGLMSPKNLIDTPHNDIRSVIQNHFSLKEKAVTAKRAKFVSVIQGVGGSNDNFLARLREEASCCELEKLITTANLEKKW